MPSTRSLVLPEGGALELELRRSPRARNMLIRILEVEGRAELVLPRRVSVAEGWRFAKEKASWIEERLAALPPRVPFEAGALAWFEGAPLELRCCPERRTGRPVRRGRWLDVPGAPDGFARAVKAWYVAEARHQLGGMAHGFADRIDRSIRRISIRDPETRWGSCSTAGNLSFSWRLMMAPRSIAEYVVVHEVAHLKAMHHGRSFWALVEKLYGDTEPPRRWLNDHGLRLRRYG
jgi:predicted metal-dependent hydrolase